MKKVLGILMIGIGGMFGLPIFDNIIRVIFEPKHIAEKLGEVAFYILLAIASFLLIKYGLKFYKS